jgi:hypothetical protein
MCFFCRWVIKEKWKKEETFPDIMGRIPSPIDIFCELIITTGEQRNELDTKLNHKGSFYTSLELISSKVPTFVSASSPWSCFLHMIVCLKRMEVCIRWLRNRSSNFPNQNNSRRLNWTRRIKLSIFNYDTSTDKTLLVGKWYGENLAQQTYPSKKFTKGVWLPRKSYVYHIQDSFFDRFYN